MRKKKRVKARAATGRAGAGIAWYAPDQWARLLEMSEDRDQLHETHAEWLAEAEQLVSQLASQGVVVRRVPVDLDTMSAWCHEQSLRFDSAGRAKFVTWWLNTRSQE
jgi:hypothetical protein